MVCPTADDTVVWYIVRLERIPKRRMLKVVLGFHSHSVGARTRGDGGAPISSVSVKTIFDAKRACGVGLPGIQNLAAKEMQSVSDETQSSGR